MTTVKVHFILTGACHVEYSGRQIAMVIPLEQEDGRPTTVLDITHQVRREWPEDLKEMREEIAGTRFKVLKTGRLLADGDVFKDTLTPTELEQCTETAEEQRAINMHLVVQRNVPSSGPKPEENEEVKEPVERGEDPVRSIKVKRQSAEETPRRMTRRKLDGVVM